MLTVHIQKLREDAKIPEYAHPGDAGMDLFSVEQVTLAPGKRAAIPTGIAMQVPEGYVALVWDKSGRAVKEGLTTLAGVIDSGYRGEVQVVVFNTSDTPIAIEPGQKVAQVLIQPVVSATITETNTLDDTSRGSGGFGSTGV